MINTYICLSALRNVNAKFEKYATIIPTIVIYKLRDNILYSFPH